MAALGVEMLTSSIRPWISGSSSAASTGSWSSSEKPPRNEGDPEAVTAWPLVERGASSRKRQVIGASDMRAGEQVIGASDMAPGTAREP